MYLYIMNNKNKKINNLIGNMHYNKKHYNNHNF